MTRRSAAIALLLSLALAAAAHAGDRHDGNVTLNTTGIERPAHWARRQDPDAARLVITTENGDAELVLNADAVALQLSDRALKRARRQLRAADDKAQDCADNPVSWFTSAILSTVSCYLDRSAECPLRSIRDVAYVNGRLEFTTQDGGRLFEHIDVDSRDVMADFPENDARNFVAEFHHLRGRAR